MAACYKLALAACKRAGVNGKYHGKSRLVDADAFQFFGVFGVGNGIADISIGKAD